MVRRGKYIANRNQLLVMSMMESSNLSIYDLGRGTTAKGQVHAFLI